MHAMSSFVSYLNLDVVEVSYNLEFSRAIKRHHSEHCFEVWQEL